MPPKRSPKPKTTPPIRYPKGFKPVVQSALAASTSDKAQTDTRNVLNVLRGKASKAKGETSEKRVKAHLIRNAGFLFVRQLVNELVPVRIDGDIKTMRIGRKRPGDFIAMTPEGHFVLVEAKSTTSKTKTKEVVLNYSALGKHQVAELDTCAESSPNAIALIAWDLGYEVRLYRWPHPDMVPNSSLTLQSEQWHSPFIK